MIIVVVSWSYLFVDFEKFLGVGVYFLFIFEEVSGVIIIGLLLLDFDVYCELIVEVIIV